MVALREELIGYMQEIHENKLEVIKPLLQMMYRESVYLEKVSFDDLDEDEKIAVIKSRKEFENGETVDFEEYLLSEGIELD